ncbi:MAG: N-acetylmuramoyl-L-alanine amidase [Planctomycetes bacterium]|nr:N-acetylmuramoyl-L-alanine amidase [Planctomycetota bacterium]
MQRRIMVGLGAVVAGLVSVGGTQREANAFPSLRTIPAASANYSRRSSRAIRRIVLHTTEGSEQSAINTFQNPSSRVSAHYLVSRAGRLTRLVQDKDVAYHVRGNNEDTIGIENEGRASDRNQWTAAQLDTLVELVRGLCDRYGIPKSRTHILSHAQLDPSRRIDPGPYFPWDDFIRRVNGGSGGGGGSTPQTYTVRTGDTLAAIAARTGVSVSELQRLNGISNPNLIFPGQVLRLSSTTPPPPPPSSSYVAEVTASSLNVRTQAFGTVLGQAPRGARFVVNQTANGWARIHYAGRDAWVSADYLRRISGAAVVRVAANTLNVRSGPSTANRALGTVGRDQDYVRLGQDGNWILIQFDGRRGYAHMTYLQQISIR